MVRPTRIAIAVAVICAIAISAAASALAATPAPRGTLTVTEYKQLSESLVALKKFNHDKKATWNEGFKACDKVGQSTALLRSVRSNCNTALGLDQALYGFYAQVARCTAFATSTTTTTTPTNTTTTGTTTTGTTGTTTTTTGTLTPQDLQFFACLQPEYALISRAAKSIYASQANLRQQVLARSFVGRCLLTLAPTRSDVEVMKRLVSTSKQLAADVLLISKVFDGTVPASDLNSTQIQKDAAAESAVGMQISRIKRPQNLAVCPHETATK